MVYTLPYKNKLLRPICMTCYRKAQEDAEKRKKVNEKFNNSASSASSSNIYTIGSSSSIKPIENSYTDKDGIEWEIAKNGEKLQRPTVFREKEEEDKKYKREIEF